MVGVNNKENRTTWMRFNAGYLTLQINEFCIINSILLTPEHRNGGHHPPFITHYLKAINIKNDEQTSFISHVAFS